MKNASTSSPSCLFCQLSSLEVLIPGGVLPDRVDVLRCPACDFVFLHPLQGNGKVEAQETTYWDNDGQKRLYLSERIRKLFVREFEHHLSALEQFSPGSGKLLDVGCGVGHFLEAARRRGWQVQGLDISRPGSEVARKTYGIPVKVGTLEEADFAQGSYDAITLWDVIEHIRRPVEALKAANRFLRPGGILAMKTPNESGFFKQFVLACYRSFGRHAAFLLKYVYYVPHYFSYSEKSMNRLLEHSGFEALLYERDGTPLEFAARKINLHYRDDSRRWLVVALLPLVNFLAARSGKGNKIVVYARKVREIEK